MVAGGVSARIPPCKWWSEGVSLPHHTLPLPHSDAVHWEDEAGNQGAETGTKEAVCLDPGRVSSAFKATGENAETSWFSFKHTVGDREVLD